MTRQKTEEEWSTEHVQDSEMGKGTTEHRGQRGQAGCACSHRPLPCYGVEGQFPTAPLGLNPGVAPSQNLVNTWAEKGGGTSHHPELQSFPKWAPAPLSPSL